VTKLSLILSVLMMSFVLVGTTSAAIQLDLTNNSAVPATLQGYAENSIFDSITKHYSGTDIVQISLTNTGNTIIYGGLLQFNGVVTDLQNVSGSNLGVGDGTQSSNLTANSICADTLTIAAGSIITINAINGGPAPLTTPEPVSWVIWLLLGLIAVLAYRRRR